MKTAIVVLVALFNLALGSSMNMDTYRIVRALEENKGSIEYVRGFRDAVAMQKRFDVSGTIHAVEKWIHDHGLQLTSASCALACEAATVVETLGVSTPVCVGVCGLIGAFGR